MLELLESNTKEDNQGLAWGECVLCGNLSHAATMHFKNGSVVPVVGETLTGGTSGRTCIVSHVYLKSGTCAGGDASGVIQMLSPTGFDSMYLVLFTDGETVSGSSGATLAADGDGSVIVTGKQYHRGQVVVYDGAQYCQPHFRWKFYKKLISDSKIDINEDIRFLSWT